MTFSSFVCNKLSFYRYLPMIANSRYYHRVKNYVFLSTKLTYRYLYNRLMTYQNNFSNDTFKYLITNKLILIFKIL